MAYFRLIQRGAWTPAAADALIGVVTAEIRLLEGLVGVLRRQRLALLTDDLQSVDDSVFATHRILVTLGEAGRHRRALGRLIGGSEDIGLRPLEDGTGERIADALRSACEALHMATLTLSREVETNRRILRAALSNGGELLTAS